MAHSPQLNAQNTEGALHNVWDVFLCNFPGLKLSNKCSIIILPPHRAKRTHIVDNCQNLVYYLCKCNEYKTKDFKRKLTDQERECLNKKLNAKS